MNHKIGLVEALCGFQFMLKHLDGRQIVVKYPAGKVIEPGLYSFRLICDTCNSMLLTKTLVLMLDKGMCWKITQVNFEANLRLQV